MTVVLEPPLTRSGPWRPPGSEPNKPLATAPRYMRSAGMGRWHRPRSGTHHGLGGHVTYSMWCGQHVSDAKGYISADAAPEGEPVCGTCEGRSIGAGQDSWPVPGLPDLLFEPRRLNRPAKCPGSRKERLAEQAGRNVVRCLACGDLVPERWYGYTGGPQNHEPGPALVAGCPFHAWTYLTVVNGAVVCACTQESAW